MAFVTNMRYDYCIKYNAVLGNKFHILTEMCHHEVKGILIKFISNICP